MEMRRFDEIIDLAAERHGGRDTFDRMLVETGPSGRRTSPRFPMIASLPP
jgi:hypothetical protein